MSYQFDLKGSQLFLLLTGLVVVAALLFLVGMIIGAGSAETGVDASRTEVDAAIPTGNGEGEQAEVEMSSGAGAVAGGSTGAAAVAATAPRATEAASRERIYEIQISAHLDEAGSKQVIEDLSSTNLRPYIVEAKDSRDRTLYTVRLGPWASMAEAAEAARQFREDSELDAYEPVIRHRPKPMAVGPSIGSGGTG